VKQAGSAGESGELTLEEKRRLVDVARESLAAHFRRERPRLPAATGALGEPRGAFVTLVRRADGDLRGCVGMMVSAEPLVDTVARMAVAAATQDSRFDAVTADELPRLYVEISVLGPMLPIRPEEVEVGRHGLLISDGRRRGVLLPQVPVEHGWDREAFLAHTCRKAGLAEDAWKRSEVELKAFTATVFGEHEPELGPAH
jgi:AmmeMemoRadiSam system protein A